MKSFPLLLIASVMACTGESAHAQAVLRITEAMSSSGPGATADWFEVTNYGTTAADITGFKMDDNSFAAGSAVLLNGVTTIAPGESVVFVESATPVTDVPAFRAFWGFTESVQVGSYTGSGVSFGSGGDAVVIFNAAAVEITRITFGAATTGRSFYYVYNSAGTMLSTGSPVSAPGSLGAFTSANASGNVGSPGISANSLDLAFTSGINKFAKTGTLYSSPLTFQKENGSDVATLSVVSGPAWLSLANVTPSGATLTGTPTTSQTGPQTVTLRLAVSGQTPVELTGVITVFAAQPRIVLNEFNGVGASDLHASLAGDLRLGRIEGNGGDWFELVVVGTGFGSTVDMRGWQIDVSQVTGGVRLNDTITLSQDNFWSAVPAGAILTFTEDNAAEGGYDTALNADNRLSSAKYSWSNIWLGDTALIASLSGASTSGIGATASGIVINNDDTSIAVRNASGVYEFGPVGEGTWRYPEINATSCFYLAADPGSGIYPGLVQADARYSALYFGKDPVVPSTFGLPNLGEAGRQPFFGTSMPYFASRPWRFAREGEFTAATVDYRQDQGQTITFQLRAQGGGALPAWVGVPFASGFFADIDLSPQPGDAGVYQLELVLTANGVQTIEPYTVVVLPATSEVILNEYNAVSSSNRLNGGVIPDPPDGDGEDTFFGSVEGNGGDWFELVVVGDGNVGTSDLRGWKIEIKEAAGDVFVPQDTLVLSQDSYWAAVPTGTILTFTEKTTAEGGLDTWIHKVNRRGQVGGSTPGAGGYVWSNIHIQDAIYLDQAASTIGEGIGVGGNNTQFRILKPRPGSPGDYDIVAGPTGEGIQPLSGISSTEVLELEADPTPAISPYLDETAAQDPLNYLYDDGNGSTFGSPNRFSGGTQAQNFSSYVSANSAPVFVNQPAKTVATGAAYSFTAITQDAEEHAVTVSVVSKPPWLSFAGHTLSGTAGPAGSYLVELRATDSQGAVTPLQYTLDVTAAPGLGFAAWGGGVAADSDHDGNGYTALAEFSLGAAAPGASFTLPVQGTTMMGGTSFLTLTAVVRTDSAGLTVTGQAAVDLAAPAAWTTTGVDFAPTANIVPAGCEERIYRTPADGIRKFLRLRMELVP
jgi:hypothetical protein